MAPMTNRPHNVPGGLQWNPVFLLLPNFNRINRHIFYFRLGSSSLLNFHATNADIAIHESFVTPQSLVEKQGFTPQAALNVGTVIHTSPAQFGKVMAQTQPPHGRRISFLQ